MDVQARVLFVGSSQGSGCGASEIVLGHHGTWQLPLSGPMTITLPIVSLAGPLKITSPVSY